MVSAWRKLMFVIGIVYIPIGIVSGVEQHNWMLIGISGLVAINIWRESKLIGIRR